MVAGEKDAARKAFAKLLNAELERVGLGPGHGQVRDVHTALKRKGVELVSYEQVRKWIAGKDIPDQANLRLVVERLKLDWKRLQTGSEGHHTTPLFFELQVAWEALATDQDRKEVLQFVRFKAARSASLESPASIKDDHNNARDQRDESEVPRAVLHRRRGT